MTIGCVPRFGIIGHPVKVDEEEEIRCQYHAAKGSTLSAASTRSKVWQGTHVVGCHKGITTRIDHDKINDELGDLHARQIFLPPELDARSCTEIIIIHQDMDTQVEDDRNPGLRGR